jgi:hypothetical protein
LVSIGFVSSPRPKRARQLSKLEPKTETETGTVEKH